MTDYPGEFDPDRFEGKKPKISINGVDVTDTLLSIPLALVVSYVRTAEDYILHGEALAAAHETAAKRAGLPSLVRSNE